MLFGHTQANKNVGAVEQSIASWILPVTFVLCMRVVGNAHCAMDQVRFSDSDMVKQVQQFSSFALQCMVESQFPFVCSNRRDFHFYTLD